MLYIFSVRKESLAVKNGEMKALTLFIHHNVGNTSNMRRFPIIIFHNTSTFIYRYLMRVTVKHIGININVIIISIIYL